MRTFAIVAVAVALVALSQAAKAIVIVSTNTVTFEGTSGGSPQPSDHLSITYDVNEISPGVYEYDYDLSTAVPQDLSSFTIGGSADPLNTATMTIVNYGSASQLASGFNSDSVGWVWAYSAGVTADDVSFTSDIAPGTSTFTVNDDDVEWTSGALIPAPVPEPSSLSLLGAATALICVLGFRKRNTRAFACAQTRPRV